MPIDDRELDRQDLQHHAYTIVQDDKLHLAPLPDTIQDILDIGTGTGRSRSRQNHHSSTPPLPQPH